MDIICFQKCKTKSVEKVEQKMYPITIATQSILPMAEFSGEAGNSSREKRQGETKNYFFALLIHQQIPQKIEWFI